MLLFSLHGMAAGDDTKLFSLYPVPLKTNRLFVHINNTSASINTIELRNLIGKKMQEKTFPAGSDEIYFDDMDTYPNGLYVVLAKDANGKVLEINKFILNK